MIESPPCYLFQSPTRINGHFDEAEGSEDKKPEESEFQSPTRINGHFDEDQEEQVLMA